MDTCFNCGKPLEHTEGKKQKKYCDEDCRGQFFRKVNHAPKYVQYKTFLELKEKFDGLKEQTADTAKRVTLISDEAGQWQTASGKKCNIVWGGEINITGAKVVKEGTDTFLKTTIEVPDQPAETEKMPQWEIDNKKQRIIDIEKELKSPPKNPLIGMKKWVLVREMELQKLKSELSAISQV